MGEVNTKSCADSLVYGSFLNEEEGCGFLKHVVVNADRNNRKELEDV
jgi:hypothetical protein